MDHDARGLVGANGEAWTALCPRPDVPGVNVPGSGLTRPLAGPGSARGRDSFGSFGLPVAPVRHSLWVPGGPLPDPPPYSGFRDVHISVTAKHLSTHAYSLSTILPQTFSGLFITAPSWKQQGHTEGAAGVAAWRRHESAHLLK